MKEKSSSQKTSQHGSSDSQQAPSAGPEGAVIAPPGYGIDFLDAGSASPEAGFGLVVQPKLMVGPGGDDPYEREADRVAQQIMRMDVSPNSVPAQRRAGQGGDESTQRKTPASAITPYVQRWSGAGKGFEAGSGVETEIARQRGVGSPLPRSVRGFMEPRFGADFRGVRVHANTRADALNRLLNARAFTTGRDIFFRGGEYRPGSVSGREILAHELTHVVQQEGGISGHGEEPVQRLIVNTGSTLLPDELSSDDGWIVGSDMDIAYYEGGEHQGVTEFSELSSYGKVEQDENIYLEGHGSPGLLGSKEPKEVAKALNDVIPEKYTGTIRSHSCSAGVGVPHHDKPSGVEALSQMLEASGINVEGASGIALNHMTYYTSKTKGTRSFSEDQGEAVDKAIAKTRGPVDIAWKQYVKSVGKITSPKYRPAAKKATEISEDFYQRLEIQVDEFLLPRQKSLIRAQSSLDVQSGGGHCFITTACVRSRGLPDDCLELETLRAFRDEYIASLANGKEMIKVYYENSPAIVEAINQRPDASEIYAGLYDIICKCVRHVQEKEYESAFQTYVDMVIKLRNRFTPMAKIPAFFYRSFKPGL